ncbi:response regulator [Pedobacter agri]|uniref:Response regulator n=1 Tax=Pedobacter agri TaxID=454586 RepID=A0A9X3DCM3_9SPHI|nr:response regulator [Pedobacter agri]MCX3264969.1 response regulator [Pedobacter agri]MDQ1142935.1 DNA-binding response OmpR family regulator [Pedobacter agri]
MKRIIIVEDDEAISEATTLALEMSGHEVVVTNEVDSLFQLIYKFGPDIILMDYSIGNANGRKLCEEIKLELKYDNVKILLFSAAVSDESEFRNPLFKYFDGFVPKPYDLEDLLSKINGQYEVN